ncbi:hypothetical protein M9H77_06272 [Catharanthus roseus]|uniref:Uncharacterized protein n=1 Tax=Catharanthus roseus TaxID=4058 RepID=A0ACC0BRL9_CATRO|nr:hypothetical protein M9H77_06272 [Catharanthus roseus]
MKKKSKAPKPKPFLATLSASSGPSLIRHLGSCNASVRFQSLKLIQSWLSTSQTQLSEDDMKRLWKGLFYCIWHSDKAAAQALLINRLSSLLLALDPLLALQYFDTFLLTLRREWNGIDHLRLDKFYLLIRKFVNAMFSLMRKHKWDLEYLGKYIESLEDKALTADDKLLGNGVNYHIASVFLDELRVFNFPLARKEVVDYLFRPFFTVMGRSLDKILVGKVKSYVFDELLRMGRKLLEKKKTGAEFNESEKGDELLGTIALKMGFTGRFYEIGSAPDCVQGNRKVIFGLHEEFLKLEKELDALRVDIGIPDFIEVDDADGEEVPELIPIDNGETKAVGVTEDTIEPAAEEEGNMKKKKKKTKKESERKDKKKKKKNKVVENSIEEHGDSSIANSSENGNVEAENTLENGNMAKPNADISSNELNSDGHALDFSESVISNLQLQFEKVAAEIDSDDEDAEALALPSVTMKKKRKRAKGTDKPSNSVESNQGEDGSSAGVKSAEKSAKKVRFSMKNNLIWKPHSPLPPQSLRIPPSVTPRGSALKKGVPPGPIREMPPATKKVKQKKGRKILRTISPAAKRLRRVKTQVLSV